MHLMVLFIYKVPTTFAICIFLNQSYPTNPFEEVEAVPLLWIQCAGENHQRSDWIRQSLSGEALLQRIWNQF